MHFGFLRRFAGAALGTLATLALSGPAGAYSNAAVKDAQALLKIQTARFQVGELYGSDLDLAKYYVLEMRFRAGELSERSFCGQAKALLEGTTDTPKDAADHPDWRQELAAQLGAMTTSTAKCRVAVAAMARIVFGDSEQPYSADALKSAEAAADKYAVLALKLEGRLVSSKAYCREAVPLLAEIRKQIDDEAAIGQRGLGDMIGARRVFYEAEARCAGK